MSQGNVLEGLLSSLVQLLHAVVLNIEIRVRQQTGAAGPVLLGIEVETHLRGSNSCLRSLTLRRCCNIL